MDLIVIQIPVLAFNNYLVKLISSLQGDSLPLSHWRSPIDRTPGPISLGFLPRVASQTHPSIPVHLQSGLVLLGSFKGLKEFDAIGPPIPMWPVYQ